MVETQGPYVKTESGVVAFGRRVARAHSIEIELFAEVPGITIAANSGQSLDDLEKTMRTQASLIAQSRVSEAFMHLRRIKGELADGATGTAEEGQRETANGDDKGQP